MGHRAKIKKAQVLLNAVKHKFFSRPRTYDDSAEDICAKILEELWTGSFYQTGLGHFNYFWIRDFGTVTRALVVLGQHDRAVATLEWALSHYRAHGRVTLCLDEQGNAFDLPTPSIDALPWLIHAIRAANMSLAKNDRDFLEQELGRYGRVHLDERTHLPRKGAPASEMRDTVIYETSAYAVAMLAALARDAAWCGLTLPRVLEHDYAKVLCSEYWNGSFFKSDLHNDAFSSEANLIPFFTEVVDDPLMLSAVLETMHQKELTKPFPVTYTDEPVAFRYHWWARLGMPKYQGGTTWTWLGAMYLHLAYAANDPRARDAFRAFTSLIERHRNFPEVVFRDGSWYETSLYRAEEGMVWSAIYLALARQHATEGTTDTE